MCHKVYSNGGQYSSVQKLKKYFEDAWYKIDPETMRDLVSSTKTRIHEVILKHGCTKF